MSTTAQTQPETNAHPATKTWTVDPVRSTAEFTIGKRLAFVMRKTVVGTFAGISGTVTLDDHNLTKSRAELSFPTASVASGQKRRDTHLKTADFFDVERFPAMTFVSRSIEIVDAAAGRYRAVGDLTIRNVTKPVTLDIDYVAARNDGNRAAARFTATATVNRHDFNLIWQNPMIKPDDQAHLRATIEAKPA